MADYARRLKARELRRKGKSINDICRTLDTAKATASNWCRDIQLTKKQKEILKSRATKAGQTGRLLGAKMNKEKREKSIQTHQKNGLKKIKTLTKRELLIAGTALYWAEGARSDSTSSFLFVNSDPEMVMLMKRVLIEAFKISEEEITYKLQLNEIQRPRINAIKKFWKNLISIPNSQFNKPYFIKTKNKKVYENHEKYYGTLRIRVKRSTQLKYKMLGLIEGLKANTSG